MSEAGRSETNGDEQIYSRNLKKKKTPSQTQFSEDGDNLPAQFA